MADSLCLCSSRRDVWLVVLSQADGQTDAALAFHQGPREAEARRSVTRETEGEPTSQQAGSEAKVTQAERQQACIWDVRNASCGPSRPSLGRFCSCPCWSLAP